MSRPLRVGLVAGEASGDTLGAGLIHALRRLVPDAQFYGIAGPKMRAAGCEVWEPSESLAVMGLFEILRDLPRLLRLRAHVRGLFLQTKPDVFVGIDSPEFNLRLARNLRAAGIPTVQYVSPQVWAWRQSRVRSIHEAVDLVLCLLPFEKRFYDEQHMPAEFVGHPLADTIPLVVDRGLARDDLGLATDAQVVALLPGSRRGEVTRLAGDFATTVRWLAAQRPALKFIAPMANAAVRDLFAAALSRLAPGIEVALLDGHAQTALIAADVVLVASGTASLETALCKRPMVVVYRLGALTTWVVRRLNMPWLKRRIAECREAVCDELAAEATSGRAAYAAFLLNVAQRTAAHASFRTNLSLGISDTELEGRIMKLVHAPLILSNRRRSLLHALCAVVLASSSFGILHFSLHPPTVQAAGLPAFSFDPSQTFDTLTPKAQRKQAPDFTLVDNNGKKVTLSNYKGKVVLLDFWATWCGGCKLEIPWYMGFDRKYRKDGLAVIGVSMDEKGWEVVRPFLAKKKDDETGGMIAMQYPIVIGNDALAGRFGLTSMPMTLLIDKDGKIAVSHTGVVDKDNFENNIRELLK